MANGRYFDNGTQRVLDDQSTQPCGCDPGAKWLCKEHRFMETDKVTKTEHFVKIGHGAQVAPVDPMIDLNEFLDPEPEQLSLFPPDDKGRKSLPVWSGVIMYFPRAIREVARVSFIGNEQHNPGEPLHWAKHKSTNQSDTALRHRMDHGVGNHYDTDGTLHLAKTCWRDLAELETFLENLETE